MGAAWYLWRNTHVYHLTENCHVINSSENATFAQYLLDVGHGRYTETDGSITLPPGMHCSDTVEDLISKI